MTDDELYNLPKVLVYSDESFGLDELTGADLSNYRLGYYEIPKNYLQHDNIDHEVNHSEFYMDFEDFESYTSPDEFMDHYEKDLSNFNKMLYRHQ